MYVYLYIDLSPHPHPAVKKAMKRREEIWPGGTALPNFILARPKPSVRFLALRALISSPIPWLFPWGRLGNLGPSVVQVAPHKSS
jgi:hypothetical protein